MTGQREAAAMALLRLVAGAFPWKTPPSRQLALWSDPKAARALRPMAFAFEGGTETTTNTNTGHARRTIEIKLFAYVDTSAGDGATQINAIADALDVALKPVGADMATGRHSLSGAAYWARIEGPTLKVPGDLDGDGILMVPVKITLP